MKGSIYKRCACRDAVTGRRLGSRCPELARSGHGSWHYATELEPGPGGKRRQVRKGGFATKREAQVALAEVVDAVAKGAHTDAGRITVGDYLEQWLAAKVEAGTLRATTARSYAQHIEDYLRPHLGRTER